MHRASSYNMYINQQDAQNSYDYTLFFNIRSTCFGFYQSVFRSNHFISCMSYFVYADTSGCCDSNATARRIRVSTWDEFKRVLSVAHASQPVERAENLEYRNKLSGVCWGAVYCSSHKDLRSESFLNHAVYFSGGSGLEKLTAQRVWLAFGDQIIVILHSKSVEFEASNSNTLALVYHTYVTELHSFYVEQLLSAGIILTSTTRASRIQNSIKGNQYLAVRNTSKLTRVILNFGIKNSMKINRENSQTIFYHCFCINIWFLILKEMFFLIPLQAWTGPEGSRMLRLPDFKTIGTWRW